MATTTPDGSGLASHRGYSCSSRQHKRTAAAADYFLSPRPFSTGCRHRALAEAAAAATSAPPPDTTAATTTSSFATPAASNSNTNPDVAATDTPPSTAQPGDVVVGPAGQVNDQFFQQRVPQPSKTDLLSLVDPPAEGDSVDEHLLFIRDPYLQRYAPPAVPQLTIMRQPHDDNESPTWNDLYSNTDRHVQAIVHRLRVAVGMILHGSWRVTADDVYALYLQLPSMRITHIPASLRHQLLKVLATAHKVNRSSGRNRKSGSDANSASGDSSAGSAGSVDNVNSVTGDSVKNGVCSAGSVDNVNSGKSKSRRKIGSGRKGGSNNVKSMLRYLSVVADVRDSGFALWRAEWNSAIAFASRFVGKSRGAEAEAALNLWKQMEQEDKANDVTFNILFDVACKAGNFTLAEMVYKEMENRGLPYNRYHYVTLIYFFGLKSDADGVRTAYQEMVEAGEVVDTVVLNCVITSFLRCHEEDAAGRVYVQMRDNYLSRKAEVRGAALALARKRAAAAAAEAAAAAAEAEAEAEVGAEPAVEVEEEVKVPSYERGSGEAPIGEEKGGEKEEESQTGSGPHPGGKNDIAMAPSKDPSYLPNVTTGREQLSELAEERAREDVQQEAREPTPAEDTASSSSSPPPLPDDGVSNDRNINVMSRILAELSKTKKGSVDLDTEISPLFSTRPDLDTFQILVNHYAVKMGDLTTAAGYLRDMHRLNIQMHGSIFLMLFKSFALHGVKSSTDSSSPASSWNEQQLRSIWAALLKALDDEAPGLYISTWMFVWVLRAFDRCSTPEMVFKAYNSLSSRSDLNDDNADFTIRFLHGLLKGKSRSLLTDYNGLYRINVDEKDIRGSSSGRAVVVPLKGKETEPAEADKGVSA